MQSSYTVVYNKRSIKYVIPGQLHGQKAKTRAPSTVIDVAGSMNSKCASSVSAPVDTAERRVTLNACVARDKQIQKEQEKRSWIPV